MYLFYLIFDKEINIILRFTFLGFGLSTMAGVNDSMVRLRDSAECDSPPRKKREMETNSEDLPPGSFFHGGKLLRVGDVDDLECRRQCKLFFKQFNDSDVFDANLNALTFLLCSHCFW